MYTCGGECGVSLSYIYMHVCSCNGTKKDPPLQKVQYNKFILPLKFSVAT